MVHSFIIPGYQVKQKQKRHGFHEFHRLKPWHFFHIQSVKSVESVAFFLLFVIEFADGNIRREKMIRVSVMYPKGGTFNFDYYVSKHMNLVHQLLDSFGLVKTEVNKGIGDSPFMAVGHLVFNSIEDMQKGLQAHDPKLAADLVNFTDVKPQFQVSEIIA
jgi:uncharacterized protein (TIGR02118 family)